MLHISKSHRFDLHKISVPMVDDSQHAEGAEEDAEDDDGKEVPAGKILLGFECSVEQVDDLYCYQRPCEEQELVIVESTLEVEREQVNEHVGDAA